MDSRLQRTQPHHHRRTFPRARARLSSRRRIDRRGSGQAHGRHRQHLDRDHAVQFTSAPARGKSERRRARRRRHAHGIQHHRHQRRRNHGHEGMKASLVSREVIADSIELVGRGYMFDAMVALAGCDKTIPGNGDGLDPARIFPAWCFTADRSSPGGFEATTSRFRMCSKRSARTPPGKLPTRDSARKLKASPARARARAAASSRPTPWRWHWSSSASTPMGLGQCARHRSAQGRRCLPQPARW